MHKSMHIDYIGQRMYFAFIYESPNLKKIKSNETMIYPNTFFEDLTGDQTHFFSNKMVISEKPLTVRSQSRMNISLNTAFRSLTKIIATNYSSTTVLEHQEIVFVSRIFEFDRLFFLQNSTYFEDLHNSNKYCNYNNKNVQFYSGPKTIY